jgi:phage shock protein C
MNFEREGRTLYRSRHGKFLGVCSGLAEYFGFRVGLVRLAAVLLALFTGFWPVIGLYILAALIMKPEPVVPPADSGEREFYESWASSRASGLDRLKRKFESLDRRIRRIEDTVTSRDFDWERRFRAGG